MGAQYASMVRPDEDEDEEDEDEDEDGDGMDKFGASEDMLPCPIEPRLTIDSAPSHVVAKLARQAQGLKSLSF